MFRNNDGDDDDRTEPFKVGLRLHMVSWRADFELTGTDICLCVVIELCNGIPRVTFHSSDRSLSVRVGSCGSVMDKRGLSRTDRTDQSWRNSC